jgi:hypothetical protein
MSRVSARERGRVSAHAVTFPGVQRLQRSAHRRLHPYTVRALAVTGMHGYNGAHIGGYARTRCARGCYRRGRLQRSAHRRLPPVYGARVGCYRRATVTTERTSAVTPVHGARVGPYRRAWLQRCARRRLQECTVTWCARRPLKACMCHVKNLPKNQ